MKGCFNPRPRTGGDELEARFALGHAWSFNPRPRTGGDPPLIRPGKRNEVSIRAPRTGGDTIAPSGRLVVQLARVSIRAPARGATVGSLNALKSYV